MRPSEFHELLESANSAFKASISVILVLVYGYVLRQHDWLSKEGESNVSKLGTTFLLPALLFSEIGPLATMSNLRSYWPIIPATLLFQVISLLTGELSKMAGMPQHYVPMFVFNNVTSLPLLLINALGATGSLDSLVRPGHTLGAVLKRGRVYILINALVGNLTRFALGPYLMKTHRELFYLHPHHDDPLLEPPPKLSAIVLPYTDDDDQAQPSRVQRIYAAVSKWTVMLLNPPLIGGAAAMIFGLIPWFHDQLFTPDGWLTPFSQSVDSVGGLYTALQMLVLGAHLYSKKGTKSNPFVLVWLFTYRFFLQPALSIAAIYYTAKTWPDLIAPDPMLHFVLMISNCGPPALTLSAIAELAHLDPETEGSVARAITLSYAVTPLISFPVTAAIEAVQRLDIGLLRT